jgi:hypothetical protein
MAIFGITKGSQSSVYIPGLKAKMDDRMGGGRQQPWWEWPSLADPMYRDWNTPETLVKLREKSEALDYFVSRFSQMREVGQLLIDEACSTS